ncbi:hypothetical protein AMK27_30685 [Streptomyces sp. CB02009]|uniref:hypothetical protein n=1 Tax=Streptomyces sp. CB02009 TaxID=1703938 RepID=UPI00093C959C|nr:hypothetical protein [Streptomyces sp. CB02009]OKJ52210.1 hypothetical protein AMK27_30685 [Streptomyces sp. CB02009]
MSFPRNYRVPEAAELLGCAERYLTDNLARLPHQKIGAAVVFDDADLTEIKELHRRRPRAAAADAAPRSLAQIRPKGARAS